MFIIWSNDFRGLQFNENMVLFWLRYMNFFLLEIDVHINSCLKQKYVSLYMFGSLRPIHMFWKISHFINELLKSLRVYCINRDHTLSIVIDNIGPIHWCHLNLFNNMSFQEFYTESVYMEAQDHQGSWGHELKSHPPSKK